MLGLIRNNHYKIISTFKLLLIFFVFIGFAVLVFGKRNTSLLTVYSYLSIVGLSLSTAIRLRKNNTGKWDQYILTFPIKRSDIVKSEFITQAISLIMGVLITGILFSSFFAIYGFLFDRYIDTLLIFSSSIGISLFMSAVFFPFSYRDNKDRTEVIGIISLLIGIGLMIGIITMLNTIFKNPTDTQLIIIGIGVQVLAIVTYLISFFYTSSAFLRQEF